MSEVRSHKAIVIRYRHPWVSTNGCFISREYMHGHISGIEVMITGERWTYLLRKALVPRSWATRLPNIPRQWNIQSGYSAKTESNEVVGPNMVVGIGRNITDERDYQNFTHLEGCSEKARENSRESEIFRRK